MDYFLPFRDYNSGFGIKTKENSGSKPSKSLMEIIINLLKINELNTNTIPYRIILNDIKSQIPKPIRTTNLFGMILIKLFFADIIQ